jgi:CHAT domain-containing protein
MIKTARSWFFGLSVSFAALLAACPAAHAGYLYYRLAAYPDDAPDCLEAASTSLRNEGIGPLVAKDNSLSFGVGNVRAAVVCVAEGRKRDYFMIAAADDRDAARAISAHLASVLAGNGGTMAIPKTLNAPKVRLSWRDLQIPANQPNACAMQAEDAMGDEDYTTVNNSLEEVTGTSPSGAYISVGCYVNPDGQFAFLAGIGSNQRALDNDISRLAAILGGGAVSQRKVPAGTVRASLAVGGVKTPRSLSAGDLALIARATRAEFEKPAAFSCPYQSGVTSGLDEELAKKAEQFKAQGDKFSAYSFNKAKTVYENHIANLVPGWPYPAADVLTRLAVAVEAHGGGNLALIPLLNDAAEAEGAKREPDENPTKGPAFHGELAIRECIMRYDGPVPGAVTVNQLFQIALEYETNLSFPEAIEYTRKAQKISGGQSSQGSSDIYLTQSYVPNAEQERLESRGPFRTLLPTDQNFAVDPEITRREEHARKAVALASSEDAAGLYNANLGWILAEEGRYEEAVPLLRPFCSRLLPLSHAPFLYSREVDRFLDPDMSDCERSYARVVFEAYRRDRARADLSRTLLQLGIAAAQSPLHSPAADGLAHAAALDAADRVGARRLVQDYEQTARDTNELKQKLDGIGDESGRSKLEREIRTKESTIERIGHDIERQDPEFWDLLATPPISLESLQATSGADAALLRGNEVLVQFYIPKGKTKGFVFAVTKERAAWAQIDWNCDQVASAVNKLRESLFAGAPARGKKRSAADLLRFASKSYVLYNALFGDAEISSILADKSKTTLMIVPSGPLTTLPPSVLVTRPPEVSAPAPTYSWLVREKALAILPTVSSLRFLRELKPADAGATTDMLFAVADPDFSGRGDAERPCDLAQAVMPRSLPPASAVETDGQATALLRNADSLPCSRIEANDLARELGGGKVLIGKEASESAIKKSNVQGIIGRAQVVEFATHAVVVGSFEGLNEPGLVMAMPAPGSDPAYDDGLLKASEIANLQFNADLVILSGCNTAAPDGEANGLSGLSRAFFFGGAKSLLVSNWIVYDDVALQLVPRVVQLRRHGNLSRSQALQTASKEMLENGADPAVWSAFSLVGEAN